MRTRVVAVIAAFSVLFTAGVASAAMDDGDGDTGFNFGYDPDANFFFTGIQNNEDAMLDCSLSGTFEAAYEEGEDGTIVITDLTEDGEEVTFEEFDHGEGDEPGDEPTEPTPYTDATECTLTGVRIGTNGVINHGQFMKAFNHLIDMRGRGCLNRYLAGSSLGKDTGDEAVEPGIIDFTNVQATCEHGNKEKDEDHPSLTNKNDRPDKANKEDKGRPRNGDDDDSDDGGSGSNGKSDKGNNGNGRNKNGK